MSKRIRTKLRIVTPMRTVTVDVTYFMENPGAPFIIVFLALLVICAFILASGGEPGANALAVYAYYSLVAGVVLQLVAYVKTGKKQREEKEAE